jgi:hypothetical protein
MKKIKLTKGKVALVDDEDFKWLSKHNWYASISGYNYYAQRTKKRKNIRMHRVILNAPKGVIVDHINGNSLDNRKQNLRLCSQSENMCNRLSPVINTSGFKGVSQIKTSKKWEAYINKDGKRVRLGNFLSAKEAALAYNKAAIKYPRDFAKLNILD